MSWKALSGLLLLLVTVGALIFVVVGGVNDQTGTPNIALPTGAFDAIGGAAGQSEPPECPTSDPGTGEFTCDDVTLQAGQSGSIARLWLEPASEHVPNVEELAEKLRGRVESGAPPDYVFGAHGPAATCDPDFLGIFKAVLYSPDLTWTFDLEHRASHSTSALFVKIQGDDLDLVAKQGAYMERGWQAPGILHHSSLFPGTELTETTAVGFASMVNEEHAWSRQPKADEVLVYVARFEVACPA